MNLLFVDAISSTSFYWVTFNNEFITTSKGHLVYNKKEVNTTFQVQQKIDGILLGIPRKIFLGKEIELPPLSPENINEAIRYKISKIFYFITNPFFIFFPLKKDYSKLLILVCEKKVINELIYNVEQCFKSKVAAVFLSSLSITSFIKQSKNKFILENNKNEIVVFNKNLQHFYVNEYNHPYLINYNNYTIINNSWQNAKNYFLNSEFLKFIFNTLKHNQQDELLFNIFPEKIKILKKKSIYHKFTLSFFIFSIIIFIISPLIKISLQTHLLKKEINKIKPEINKIRYINLDLEKKIKETKLILNYFIPRKIDILALVAQNLPKTTDIRYIYIDHKTFKCKGYALKAPEVLSKLNKINIFKNVKFIGPILKQKKINAILESFHIEAQLVQK